MNSTVTGTNSLYYRGDAQKHPPCYEGSLVSGTRDSLGVSEGEQDADWKGVV